ncbi:MAG: hypothetical protein ACO1PN_12505, partial [Betaproteobacteria bacterium]
MNTQAHTRKKLVILVHGIRTRALWQKRIAPQLRSADVVVEAIGYQYFNVFEFLSPVGTRGNAIASIRWRLEKALVDYPDHELILLAHSFGTYCVANILQSTPGIKPALVILCGSVVSEDFRWDLLRQQPRVVNECGTKDVWPCIARAATWGYGSAGTFGFKTPGITDRYHPIAHSGYFEGEFARTYWLPLIQDGTIVESKADATLSEPPWWMSLLSMKPALLPWLGWLLVLAVLALSFFPIKDKLFSAAPPAGTLQHADKTSASTAPPYEPLDHKAIPFLNKAGKSDLITGAGQLNVNHGRLLQKESPIKDNGYFTFVIPKYDSIPSHPDAKLSGGVELRSSYEPNLYMTAQIQPVSGVNTIDMIACGVAVVFKIRSKAVFFWASEIDASPKNIPVDVDFSVMNTFALRQVGQQVSAFINGTAVAEYRFNSEPARCAPRLYFKANTDQETSVYFQGLAVYG